MPELTPQERALTLALAECWNSFLKLPSEHPSDQGEFLRAIHAAQNVVLSRPARRTFDEPA